jgi:hypothetical protein
VAALRDVTAQHHEQLDELALAYLGDRSRLEQIDRHELAERIAAGDVVVFDVRPSSTTAVRRVDSRTGAPSGSELTCPSRSQPRRADVVGKGVPRLNT